jgi:hypothetical protein
MHIRHGGEKQYTGTHTAGSTFKHLGAAHKSGCSALPPLPGPASPSPSLANLLAQNSSQQRLHKRHREHQGGQQNAGNPFSGPVTNWGQIRTIQQAAAQQNMGNVFYPYHQLGPASNDSTSV